MKKKVSIMLATILGVCCLSGCGNSQATQETTNANAQETSDGQVETKEDSAILVVSFGTSYNDSRDITIGAIEGAIKQACPEYEVRRAFTSQIIIDILKERDGLEVDNVKEALDRAVADGVKELIVQPTHLMNGFEYNDLAKELTEYVDKFDKIVLAEPLLMSDADYATTVKAITEKTAEYDDGKTAICFMGHGTEAESNSVYAKLQDKLTEGGYENYYIGTVEAVPSLDDVIVALKAKGGYERVILKPLMVVAGDHANNDMAGNEADSWKSVLEKEGYKVECVVEGLGQNEDIQSIYVEHLKNAIAEGTAFEGVKAVSDKSEDTVLKDGVYSIEVESSSSVFKIKEAELVVSGDELKAVVTIDSTAYDKLYLGSAEQAATADEAEYLMLAEGEYTCTLPITALDEPIACAAHSINKNEWYDRQLTFISASAVERTK